MRGAFWMLELVACVVRTVVWIEGGMAVGRVGIGGASQWPWPLPRSRFSITVEK